MSLSVTTSSIVSSVCSSSAISTDTTDQGNGMRNEPVVFRVARTNGDKMRHINAVYTSTLETLYKTPQRAPEGCFVGLTYKVQRNTSFRNEIVSSRSRSILFRRGGDVFREGVITIKVLSVVLCTYCHQTTIDKVNVEIRLLPIVGLDSTFFTNFPHLQSTKQWGIFEKIDYTPKCLITF